MKLVFFGTPDFAIPSLYALHKSTHEVLAVVTMPDKYSGRGLKKTASSIKQAAEKLNYSIYQPPDLNDSDLILMTLLLSISPDNLACSSICLKTTSSLCRVDKLTGLFFR